MQVIVRYKVKPECAEENKALIRNVFAELAETQPDGLHYASFVAADGVTFMHVAKVTADSNPLPNTASFKAFQENLKDRCVEPPNPVQLEEIGSCRFHDG